MDILATTKGYKPVLKWRAVYKDGSTLDQGEALRFSTEHIDRPRLRQFMLLTFTDTPVLKLELKPGRKFLYRSRTALRQDKGVVERIHIVGWEEGETRRLAFVRESNLSVEYGDFVTDPALTKDRPWLYPFERLPTDETLIED